MLGKVLLESANGLYKLKIIKQINIVAKIIALSCDISLQCDCNFINTYKADISTLRKTISLIKIPTNLLAIASTILQLQEHIQDYNEYNRTKKNKLIHNELKAQILSKAVSLVINIVEILVVLKITELLGKKADAVNLLPGVLFMTLLQPIHWYSAYTEYSNTGDSSKFRKYGLETATLGFTILSFVLKNVVQTQDILIVLGPNLIIYTLNYGVLASMACTAISIFSTLDVLYFTEQSLDSSPDEIHDLCIEPLDGTVPFIT